MAQRCLDGPDDAAQVRVFVVFLDSLTIERVMPFIAEQLGQQLAVMPAFVWCLDAAQSIDLMPKLTGFTFAQFAQLSVVARGLLPTALDDALFGEGMQRLGWCNFVTIADCIE